MQIESHLLSQSYHATWWHRFPQLTKIKIMHLTEQHSINNADLDEHSFDDLMASLFVLVTHHSLTQCESALPQIVDRIHHLTNHVDIEYYPNQLKVLLKMNTLWRTKLFRSEVSQLQH